jgi:predicted DNA-binding transcriptional regulator YafY
MTDRPAKIQNTQRWLDLVAYLVGRRMPATVDEIMEKVPAYAQKLAGSDTDRDTVRRMFERDKDGLRDAGIPIESVEMPVDFGGGKVDAYVLLKKNFHLPYLRIVADAAGQDVAGSGARIPRGAKQVSLREDECRTAFHALESVAEIPSFPLRPEARSAWRKLSFDLVPPPGGAAVLYADRSDSAELTDWTRILTEALLARKTVRFKYHGIYRGTPTDRHVRPYGLLFQHGHWYLVGHDENRDDVRVFRVERMEEPRPNSKQPHTADYDIPEEFSLEEFRDREAWELGSGEDGVLEARVKFEFPLSLWAERNGFGELESEDEQGNSIRKFEIRQVDPFLRWILSQRGEARIVEPPELVERVTDLAREVMAVYGAVGGTDG